MSFTLTVKHQCDLRQRHSVNLHSFAISVISRTSKVVTFFFSIWVLFHGHSRITGLQGKGEGIPLTPHYHFHQLHRHLDISQAITTKSSPLHIASSWTRTVFSPNAEKYGPEITPYLETFHAVKNLKR